MASVNDIRKANLILLLSTSFVAGVASTYFLLPIDNQDKQLIEQTHKLFIIDQKIISASDHAFVEQTACMQDLNGCDFSKLNGYIGKVEQDRKQLLVEKKQLISEYPSLIPESEREFWK